MPNHIFHSFLWKYLERSGSQILSFAVSIVLARLLAPDDFGLLALVTVFIAIANVFVRSGLNAALVQKKDVGRADFSTVFWFSLTIAATAYAILFLSAPLIAGFYKNENLISVVRVLGITLFFEALNSVQGAYIQKHFLFKKLFFRGVVVIIPSGIVSVSLAYMGFGIWALVWQQLTSAFLMSVFMLIILPWKPAFEFSTANAKKLFNFGYKLLLSGLLETGYRNIANLLIGKFFSSAILGFYNRGEQFPRHIVGNVSDSMNAVLFPALANVQDNIESLKQKTKRCIKCSCFVIFPLMALLASSAKPTVEFVLSEKWLPCVVFLQISCLIFALLPLQTANLTSINSLGKSDIVLKLEIVKKIVSVSALIIAIYVFGSPVAVVTVRAVTSLIGLFINSFPNKYLLNYGFFEQIGDVAPSFILSLASGLAVFPISKLGIPNFAVIALQVIGGLFFYLFWAKIFKMESLNYLLQTLRTGMLK